MLRIIAWGISFALLFVLSVRLVVFSLGAVFRATNRRLALPKAPADEESAFAEVRASIPGSSVALTLLERFLEAHPDGPMADEARVRLDHARKVTRREKKRSPREESARRRALWREVFSAGLSPAKLFAVDLLHPTFSVLHDEAWRGWCRLALEASGSLQKEATDRVLSPVRQQREKLASISLGNLRLLLKLVGDEEGKALELEWARYALARPGQRAEAKRLLETLAKGDDTTAARGLFALADSALAHGERSSGFAIFARYLKHPCATEGDIARMKLRASVTPTCVETRFLGRTLARFRDTRAVSFSLRALKLQATPEAWLARPAGQLHSALPGEEFSRGALRLWALPFSPWSWGLYEVPSPRGAFVHTLSLEARSVEGWSECFEDEALPSNEYTQRRQNLHLDAVLSLTEERALVWVVDTRERRPVAGIEVVFFTQDATGESLCERRVSTDEHGLAALSDVSFWRLGALIERPGEHGASETLFLTHGVEIDTRAHAPTQERLYLWMARPLYRPGELVRGELIARVKGPEGASRRMPQGKGISLVVHGPKDNRVAALTLILSPFGTCSFSFTLPGDAPLGKYRFTREGHYGALLEGSFYVEEFVAPEFRAKLTLDEPPRWGAPSSLGFEASYFFGGPVANAAGTLEIVRRPWKYMEGGAWPPARRYTKSKGLSSRSFTTDAQGRAKVRIPWRGPFDPLRLRHGCDFDLKATLRDASGKTCEAALTVCVKRARCIVEVTLPNRLRVPGEALALALRWLPEPGEEHAVQSLNLVFSKGFRRHSQNLRVSPGQRDIRVESEFSPGRWRLRGALSGSGQPLGLSHDLWVLGDELPSQSYPRLLFSAPSAKAGERVRVALLGAPSERPASAFLHCNSGARLEGKAVSLSGSCAWMDLTLRPEDAPMLYARAWFHNPSNGLSSLHQSMEVSANDPPLPEALSLSLSFPGTSAEPGADTTLMARVEESVACELVCRVIDESIVALVPCARDPQIFFEESPPRASNKPAWSAAHASAQTALVRRSLVLYEEGPNITLSGGAPPQGAPYGMLQSEGCSSPLAGPIIPTMAGHMMNVSPGAPMASRSRSSFSLSLPSIDLSGLMPEQAPEAPAVPEPVALRSDFSSEAAFHSGIRLHAANPTELDVKFSDALSTWLASGLVLSVDERMGSAEARIKTHKPLMIRLQSPRFLQERDAFTLRAMIDSREENPSKVRSSLIAPSLKLLSPSDFELTLEAGGQSCVECEAEVLPSAEPEITLRAEARSEGASGDAEERRLPYRPYGIERVITLRGVLSEDPLVLSLPEARRPEYTALVLQLDRGPLDAVLAALSYLLEYPYGCVEQTCSRIIPNLVWQELEARGKPAPEGLGEVYRGNDLQPTQGSTLIEDGLKRLAEMQGDDGGYGWWPRGQSDVWMTAYVVFSLSLAKRPETERTARACRFLEDNLLDVSNREDSDAFAVFALAWAGRPPSEHTLEVMLPRWNELSLSDQARLCWVLAANKHGEAPERLKTLCRELLPDAKRWLKAVAREGTRDPRWFRPAATEGIAFLVLALLQTPEASPSSELRVFVSFLLMHRRGGRWHSTRDTALAVLALLTYENHFGQDNLDVTLRVRVNGDDKARLALRGLGEQAPRLSLGDEALSPGENTLELLTEKPLPDGSIALPKHYSLSLRYFSREDKIPALSQGIEITRSYWLLNDTRETTRRLSEGELVTVGQRLRVELSLRAQGLKRYILIEDPKVAGCEPVATLSSPAVCQGRCAHVELRVDRTAIFLDTLDKNLHTLTYDIDARVAGSFTAMPARAEPMYESECFGQSPSFAMVIR